MPSLRGFIYVLREYCLNSSISGLSYIADGGYHVTERCFWLVCLLACLFGTYHFIMDTMVAFEADTVSMVVESLQPLEQTPFPSVAVCEMGFLKDEYAYLEQYADNLTIDSEDEDNSGDVYDYLMRIVYFNLYTSNTFQSYCKQYEDKDDVVQCPQDGFIEFSKKSSVSCSDLMTECKWMGKPFDCCQYFQPLRSTYGPCFFLNNLQAATKNGPHWLDTTMDISTGPGHMQFEFSKSTRICVLDEAEVPNLLLSRLHFELRNPDVDMRLVFSLQQVTNDPDVRNIPTDKRQCMFADEEPLSRYRYYSAFTCIAECIKQAQVRACGCAHHYMTADETDETPKCDYAGLVCLDGAQLIFPTSNILQPWSKLYIGEQCKCQSSCTTSEIKVVSLSSGRGVNRQFSLRLIDLPTQRYRRKRNKDSLDYVVAIGGIVGLFLGASILSLVELVYFFTVRLLGSAWMKRSQRRQQQLRRY